ncbi:MAG: hypothetical protein ACRDRA_02555 [Pseudonocardiaceae bacterium]
MTQGEKLHAERAETARIGFAPEIEVACAMPELDGSVEASLRIGDHALGAGRLTAEEPCKRLELGLLRRRRPPHGAG